MAPANNLL
ncbi:hypothetical protein CP082626L3_0056A, partial [Chlamydia psittaci 08-2626_L3]